MPCTPSVPSSGHSSRGNVLLRSISSARGAILSAAKARTLSRSRSAVSPRSKSRPVLLRIVCLRPRHETGEPPHESTPMIRHASHRGQHGQAAMSEAGTLRIISGVGAKGPACFLLEAQGKRLMLDLGYGPQPGLWPNVDDVGRVDALLLTHSHKDHIGGLSLHAEDRQSADLRDRDHGEEIAGRHPGQSTAARRAAATCSASPSRPAATAMRPAASGCASMPAPAFSTPATIRRSRRSTPSTRCRSRARCCSTAPMARTTRRSPNGRRCSRRISRATCCCRRRPTAAGRTSRCICTAPARRSASTTRRATRCAI